MTAQKALLLMVDESGLGQMIVDGTCYMVRSTWMQGSSPAGTPDHRPRWTIYVTVEKSLDEEAQRRRIDGLEAELSRERERLNEIRVAFSGEETEPVE